MFKPSAEIADVRSTSRPGLSGAVMTSSTALSSSMNLQSTFACRAALSRERNFVHSPRSFDLREFTPAPKWEARGHAEAGWRQRAECWKQAAPASPATRLRRRLRPRPGHTWCSIGGGTRASKAHPEAACALTDRRWAPIDPRIAGLGWGAAVRSDALARALLLLRCLWKEGPSGAARIGATAPDAAILLCIACLIDLQAAGRGCVRIGPVKLLTISLCVGAGDPARGQAGRPGEKAPRARARHGP